MESNDGLIRLLQAEGISSLAVLEAMAKVDRVKFVPDDMQAYAYIDEALPIEGGQTVSQPFVVARMSELLLDGKDHLESVLEVGTGSGYQAAVLSQLATQVYTIERIEELYVGATERLQACGFSNVHTKYGDGYLGWPENVPYEAIIVAAAPTDVPQQLLAQLDRDSGRLIVPVGGARAQELQLIRRDQDEFTVVSLDPVAFVPMLPGLK